MSLLTMARKGFMQAYNISKEPVTVRRISGVTRNSQDDVSLTVAGSDSQYAKVVHKDNIEELKLESGIMGDADVVMYFPWDYTSGLVTGNYITYNSNNYRIERVAPQNLSSGLVFTKVFLKETDETFS